MLLLFLLLSSKNVGCQAERLTQESREKMTRDSEEDGKKDHHRSKKGKKK